MPAADTPAVPARGRAAPAALFLFLAVLGLFLPALRNGFINYDDPDYVTENPRVRAGLTWGGLRWAFGSGDTGNWHPLTWLSHMADCRIFGLNPLGHHLTSILLHAFSAVLLFLALRQMTGAAWRSLVAAALFGCHPLRVESVAWVAERKDVLSVFFAMLALWAYAAWAAPSRKGKPRAGVFYGLALACLVLGLMSKSMLVSLPFVLLLLDYWPLDRLQAAEGTSFGRVLARRTAEKAPFFAAAAAAAAATVMVQRRAGAVIGLATAPIGTRLENAMASYCRYLGKIFFPEKLAVFYPYPRAFPAVWLLGAAALLLGVTAAAVALRRRQPYLLVGWLWYLGTLVPVIGLVQVGTQSMADRYTYLPSIGIFVIVVWGAHALASGARRAAPGLGVAAGAAVFACSLITSRQITFWKNNETLYRHALAVTKDNWLAHFNLAYALSKDPNRRPEAIAQYEETLRLTPAYAKAYYNLGNVEASAGLAADAAASFGRALRIQPDYPEAHNERGDALMQLGRLPEAAAEYRAALKLQPTYLQARENLGMALAQLGQLEQAVEEFRAAARLLPDDAEIRNNLGSALALLGRTAEARREFEEALRLQPGDAEAKANLARLGAAPEER